MDNFKKQPKHVIYSINQVSMSPTFYAQFFSYKILRKTFFCTYILGLSFFGAIKNIGTNALLKCWWNWPQSTLPITGRCVDEACRQMQLLRLKSSEVWRAKCLPAPFPWWKRLRASTSWKIEQVKAVVAKRFWCADNLNYFRAPWSKKYWFILGLVDHLS